MRKPFLIFALLAACAASAPGVRAQRLLPDRFGQWTISGSPVSPDAEPSALPDAIAKETGVTPPEGAEYSSNGMKIVVRVRKFRDPSSAYEAYTSWINPTMQPSTVGGASAVDPQRLLVLAGNLILEILPPQSPSTEELKQLAKAVRSHADQSPLPPIRAYLPDGFNDGTQKYALGPQGFHAALDALHRSEYAALANEVGFVSGAESMLAEYHRGRDAGVLLLIEYPTPQLAEQHLHHLQTVLPNVGQQAEIKIERRGSLLSLVLGPSSPEYAESLRGAVNYETEVTWHEPTHTITDPPWATILGKIFVATFLFMLVAVALGAAFGGVRVVLKAFFPGKVFDRPERMEILQLGLSGKKVDPRDFY